EAGAYPRFAVHPDVSTRLLDDAVDRGKTKTRSLSGFFCSEERLKDSSSNLFTHADTGIAHGQKHIPTRCDAKVVTGVFFREMDVPGVDRQLSPERHGIASIDREIHQH